MNKEKYSINLKVTGEKKDLEFFLRMCQFFGDDREMVFRLFGKNKEIVLPKLEVEK